MERLSGKSEDRPREVGGLSDHCRDHLVVLVADAVCTLPPAAGLDRLESIC